MEHILPNYSMPWFHGLLSVVLITVGICVIIELFQIRGKAFQCLLAAVVISFPSEIGTMLYMFTSSSYAVAFLMAVLSVYLFEHGDLFRKLLACVCLVFSCSIYQAYVAVAASFFVILAIQHIMSSGGGTTVHEMRNGVKYIAFLAISLLAYYAITHLLLLKAGEELNGWALRAISGPNSIGYRLYRTWILFIAMIVKKAYGLVPNTLSLVAHSLFVCSAGVSYVYLTFRKRPWGKKLLLLLLLGVAFPLSVNCLVLLLGENGIHGLTLYSFISVYILAIVVFEQLPMGIANNIGKDICTFGLVFIVGCNIVTANKSYLKQYLVYENTVSFYQSIITQVQMTKDFSEGTKLAVIGTPDARKNYLDGFGEDTVYGMGGYTGGSISDYFISFYLGADVEFATEEEKNSLRKDERFLAMTEYPYNGYVEKIDDYIVVKLGSN